MKVLTVLFLVVMAITACVNLPVPPPEFTMHCDVCGEVTKWGVAEEYFYCRQSGTIWNPLED